MSLEIQQEALTHGALSEHGRISIAFEVDRILEVTLADGGLGGMTLTVTPVADPYIKDYDAIEGEGPARWAARFDLSNWGLIRACRDRTRVGGAVLAFRTADLHMLGGRDDVAVLWDIRVTPEQRGTGVGSALFGAAANWASARGVRLAEDRDPERQRRGVPLLPEDGLHPWCDRPVRLSRTAR